MANSKKPVVPVFFGCDQRFTPFMGVALISLLSNISTRRRYEIHILHTDINEETQAKFIAMARPNASIEFHNVESEIAQVVDQLPIRDYYSASTYYRFVIATKFPQYDKALYIDSDTAIVADVAKLFDINIGNNYVGAVNEAVMTGMDPTGRYTEKVLGISRRKYFNAGMMVINCDMWRKKDVLGQFIQLVSFYNFVVAQDQDYLNVICKNKVHLLPRRWNMEAIRLWNVSERDYGIIHYAFAAKPWHDINCNYGTYFWKYASQSPDYLEIKSHFASITPEKLEAENNVAPALMAVCEEEIQRHDNFLRRIQTKRYSKALETNPITSELLERLREIA